MSDLALLLFYIAFTGSLMTGILLGIAACLHLAGEVGSRVLMRWWAKIPLSIQKAAVNITTAILIAFFAAAMIWNLIWILTDAQGWLKSMWDSIQQLGSHPGCPGCF